MKPKHLLAVITLPTLLSVAVPTVASAQTGSTDTSTTNAQSSSTGTQKTVQLGANGTDVVQLQNDLNALGFTVGQATGTFGTLTESMVKSFQQKAKLTTDGVVGPMTWSALDAAMKSFQSSPVQLSVQSKAVTHIEKKQIYYNGKLVTSPDGFTYNSTDYMPIWYVMYTLTKMGFKNTWSNNVWNITVPSSTNIPIDFSKISYGKGSTSIAINGTVVARVDSAVHVDPASNKPTTFMPTWYVMNALKRIAVQSNWQGTTWKMTPSNATTGQPGSGHTTGTVSSTPTNTTSTSNSTSGNNNTVSVSTTNNTTGNNTTTNNSTSNETSANNTTTDNTTTNNTSGTTSGNTTGNTTGNTNTSSSGDASTTTTTTTTSTTAPQLSFTNVDLRFAAPASVNQASIDNFLLAHNSPMTGLGPSFMAAQNTYGVDANYLVSHAILESYWGQSKIALAKNNLFGYGAYDSNPGNDAGMFPSDDYAIRFQAWEVRNNYLNPGASLYVTPTLTGMNVHYATDKLWANSIGGLMNQFATSTGSSVNAYQQYQPGSSAPVPQPSSSTEPVFYLNGATGVIQTNPYYGGGVPYFQDMATGMRQQFFGELKDGSSGEPVGEIQTFMNKEIASGAMPGPQLTVDGQFGPVTQTAVKDFQSSVMHMAQPDGVWSFAMWTQYIGQIPTQQTIPEGTSVTVDQIKQGMAGGLVVPWYHIPNFGWVDSEYLKFTNVYRVEVSNPSGTQTTIPVYNPANPSQQIATLHSGDIVVAQSPTPTNGGYAVQIASETPILFNGMPEGTPIKGLIPSNGQVTLVQQQ